MPRKTRLLRSASVVLFLAAVALGWMAFTRFDGGEGPPPGSPGFREYEREQMRDAQVSAAFGVATAFALLGCFACWQRAAAVAATGADPPRR